ncbi:transposable element Tcb2 transposase [Trichonephila clavipes]|nr:transposable element Tcb2 transposase [Trichonephila clavipes]
MLIHAEVALQSGRGCYISQGKFEEDISSNQSESSYLALSQVKNSEKPPSRQSTVATPPGSYRPANRHHATQQNAGPRAVLLARWIVRSVPLEIVGSSEHEKAPTRGKPGLERPGRPRGDRIKGSHLAEGSLKSKRSFRALPLTPEHRQLRLQWCQARSMWNVTDWQKVVFSDESRFVLGTDDNRVRVWRHPAYDSRSTLIVMRGTLTGQRYVDDILRPHVGPFLNGLPRAIFQQDNARPHTARVSQDFLRHFQTLPWPACSPICPL